MIIQGQPRELKSVRKIEVFRKVYVVKDFDAPLVGRIRAGEVGTITAVYGEGEKVQVSFGREFEVIFDRSSLRTHTRPFEWVKLAAKPGREIATLYHWSR